MNRERGFFTVQNSGYAKALFVPKINFFPPKTIHNPWVLVLSVRKSPNSQLTPYNETGDGIKTPLRWNEVYHCGGYNEVKSIGIEGSEGLVLLAVKFGGKVLKLTPCQADLFNKK